jgi:hypothetical protein
MLDCTPGIQTDNAPVYSTSDTALSFRRMNRTNRCCSKRAICECCECCAGAASKKSVLSILLPFIAGNQQCCASCSPLVSPMWAARHTAWGAVLQALALALLSTGGPLHRHGITT